ncbi:MAG: alpha/beta hydrolase, partial [Prevotella sp.]|nr:alpha/beta hydrolase [Prevotella sp.]
HVPVAFANLSHSGHGGTFAEEYGGSFSKLAICWLDWQLKGKSANSSIFRQLKLADFTGWTIESKNFK